MDNMLGSILLLFLSLTQTLPANKQSEEKTEVVLDRIARVNNLKMGLNNNEVETNELNDVTVHEGDIIMSDAQYNHLVSNGNQSDKRTTYHHYEYLWKSKILPYEIDPNMPSATMSLIEMAVTDIQAKTCLSFRKRISEKNWIRFTRQRGCWSSVGRQSYLGAQNISIGTGCDLLGIVQHEVMHALDSFLKHDLVKTLLNLNLTQLVKCITRPVSNTCLDHIYSSHPDRMHNVVTLNVGLSDHLPVFALRRFKKTGEQGAAGTKIHEHTSLKYRNLKSLNNELFAKDLSEAPWDSAFVFEDTDDIVDSWYSIFINILNKHAPIISKRVKRKIQPKWFTNDITDEIQIRDRLLKQALNEHRENPNKLWSLIKDLSRVSLGENNGIRQLNENGELVTESRSIAEIFNSFFVSQPQRLLSSIKSTFCNESLLNSLKIKIKFEIPHISPEKVLQMLNSMPANKATGADGLSPKLLKIAAPSISSSVARLINHCISTNTFPSRWKVAKVTPIFKNQGSVEHKQNYRPISVLPILSKLYERYLYKHYIHTYAITISYMACNLAFANATRLKLL
ncbi:RNA-directed DNA polymerase from mobile element jockey [Paramuricea clavata]|uniref:RNA-directed DNA polymerase from mobile element jockey n=1 Tax=Paramuricea clavata TaxID=317549 RepID=A0A7D9HIQ5_PARCT|nr:RNA-directed DNA polymerase from mobile element jockey [Paramuricea clavata]